MVTCQDVRRAEGWDRSFTFQSREDLRQWLEEHFDLRASLSLAEMEALHNHAKDCKACIRESHEYLARFETAVRPYLNREAS